jgi:alpha-L-rhamnosidase
MTPYGEGGITWRNEEASFSMDITVPVSSHATVFVPATDQETVFGGGRKHDHVADVEFVRMEGDYAVFWVGSGDYKFSVADR